MSDLPPAAEILERLASESNVDPAVADASVESDHAETATVTVESKLTVEDANPGRARIPRTEYERLRDERPSYAARFESAPTSFTDSTVPFVEAGREAERCENCAGEGRHTCPKCDGTERHDCPTCDGTKTYTCPDCDGTATETCPDCQGDTQVDCPNCEHGSVTCPKCDGDPETTCRTCGGDGNCTACGGSPDGECDTCGGTASIDCDACDGSGVGRIGERKCGRCGGGTTVDCECNGNDEDCPDCGGDNSVECPRCEGSGSETYEVDCDVCGGDGEEGCPDCGGSGACTVCESTGDCTDCRGDGTVRRCIECHGYGSVDCSNCDGDNRVDCGRCDAQGEITCQRCDGATELDCTRCSPEGLVTCTRCDGRGDVECAICEGDGETVAAKRGEITFRADEDVSIATDEVRAELIDAERYVLEHDPDRRERHPSLEDAVGADEPTATDGGVYRHRVDTYEVPVRSVRYSLRGNRYGVACVVGDGRNGADTLEYDDYPVGSDRLRDRIEPTIDDGYFEYRSEPSILDRLANEPRQLFGDGFAAGVGTVGSAVLLAAVGFVFGLASLWGSTGLDAVGIGAAALGGSVIAFAVGLFLRNERFATVESRPGAAYGGFAAPIAGGLLAAGAVATGALSGPLTLVVVSAAAVLWIARVSQRLYVAGERASHLGDTREEFLDTELPADADIDDLREHGLDRLLPDADAKAASRRFSRLSVRVLGLCWAPAVFYLSAAVLSVVLGPPRLFAYLSPTVSLALPAAVALVSTLALAPLAGTDLSGADSVEAGGGSGATASDSRSASATDRRSGTSTASDRSASSDLTESQFELLVAVDRSDDSHGLAIKEWLEARQNEEITHGELYPALDSLVEADLLDKGQRDRRTNYYTLTDAGRDVLATEAERADAIDERKAEIRW